MSELTAVLTPPTHSPLLTSPILFLPSKASDHGPLPAEGGGPPWGPAVSVMAHLCGRAPATADGWQPRPQQRALPGQQPAGATDRWGDREGTEQRSKTASSLWLDESALPEFYKNILKNKEKWQYKTDTVNLGE